MLIIAFVTADAAVIETVIEKRNALLPSGSRVDGCALLDGEEAVLKVFDTRVGKAQQDLLEWLGWDDASGVLILTDESMPGLVDALARLIQRWGFEGWREWRKPLACCRKLDV